MVRLKANKYYEELLYYLSSYINFLNIRPLWLILGLWLILDFEPLIQTFNQLQILSNIIFDNGDNHNFFCIYNLF